MSNLEMLELKTRMRAMSDEEKAIAIKEFDNHLILNEIKNRIDSLSDKTRKVVEIFDER